MTQIIKPRKERINLTIEQKLDYAKLMVHENYTNKKIMAISGAGPSAITRWKKQYLAEINGQTPESGKAMTPEQQEIQSLKKQLWRSQRDNEILKKATALFAVDNQNTL
ncbi:Mobile element protein [uncultured Candidatus Thioglobus sp.]|nr:Mobile element protein [uncultured Candidatus Thioglobus sp.]SMN00357.1 Mobile element protein [uncultured Candidatus Thioglobus sp.]